MPLFSDQDKSEEQSRSSALRERMVSRRMAIFFIVLSIISIIISAIVILSLFF